MHIHLLRLYEELLVGEIKTRNSICLVANSSMDTLVKAIGAVGVFYNYTSNTRILGALARLAAERTLDKAPRLLAYQMIWNVLGQIQRMPVMEPQDFDPDNDMDWFLLESLARVRWVTPNREEDA